jgi:hypothetical protein
MNMLNNILYNKHHLVEADVTIPLFMYRYRQDCLLQRNPDYLGLGIDIFSKITDLCTLNLFIAREVIDQE